MNFIKMSKTSQPGEEMRNPPSLLLTLEDRWAVLSGWFVLTHEGIVFSLQRLYDSLFLSCDPLGEVATHSVKGAHLGSHYLGAAFPPTCNQ